MPCVKNTIVQKLKIHPVYEDITDSRRKVAIVRGTLL